MIATPIGNLEDLTPRARRVLGEVSAIAAEDTRTARRLLTHAGIRARLLSFHEHSGGSRRAKILAALQEGDVALVSEAGTPAISDPGAKLVSDALERGHRVVAVPGPCAVTAALSVSGLPADSYTFLGFTPRRGGERRRMLAAVADETRTLVLFEAPHRLRESLADMVAVLGDRSVTVAREMTKLHEEVWHGTLAEACAEWSRREPRGEFTLVIAGAPARVAEPWDEEKVRAALQELRASGASAREASRELAAIAGWTAREIYSLWEHDK